MVITIKTHEEQREAEPTVTEIFLRHQIVERLLSGSSTVTSNQIEAEEIMCLCESDVHFKDAHFEAKDLQTVGYMKYFRSTALELRESKSGVSASAVVHALVTGDRYDPLKLNPCSMLLLLLVTCSSLFYFFLPPR